MAFAILNLRNATLVSIAEVIGLATVFPGHLPSSNPVAKAATLTLCLNYFVLISYWAFIFPTFVSSVRSQPHIKFALARAYVRRYSRDVIIGETFLQWSKAIPNDGIIVFPRLIGPSRLLLTHPASLADVLVAHVYDYIKPPRFTVFMKEVIGKGLILVEGDQHTFMRKQTLPAFSRRRIKDLYPMMWSKGQDLAEILKAHLRSTPGNSAVTEIGFWASKVTLDVMGVASLGREFGTLRGGEDVMVDDYYTITDPSKEMTLYFHLAAIFSTGVVRFLPWKMHKVFNDTAVSIRRNCLRLVQEKTSTMAKGPGIHHDIISHLIQTESFSDEELNEQALTFLMTGQASFHQRYRISSTDSNRHETTSLAFTWACFLLAKHRDIQAKLHEEVKQSFAPYGSSVLKDDDVATMVERLPYLSAVVNEVLRIFPPVPLTMRVAIKDTFIMGHFVPKGTEIMLSPWVINRSENLWGPDAATFRPERWIDKNGKANNHGGAHSNYSHLTFLQGPHNCVGQDLVKSELRCLLATMVKSFRWTLGMDEKDVLPGGSVAIKPKNGLYLQFEEIVPEEESQQQ